MTLVDECLTVDEVIDVDSEESAKLSCPYFHTKGCLDKKHVERVLNALGNVERPCSLKVESTAELRHHMSFARKVADAHYFLGRKYNLKGSFPRWCCGISSRNFLMSMLMHGYPSAAAVYSRKHMHGYNFIPFVMGQEGGVIVVDPTSDQRGVNSPRNEVCLRWGTRWDYRTEWDDGADLFPTHVLSADRLTSIWDELDYENYHDDAETYLQRAYQLTLSSRY